MDTHRYPSDMLSSLRRRPRTWTPARAALAALAALALLAVVAPPPARAQDARQLVTGRVVDESRAPIEGAWIRLANVDGRAVGAAIADSAGWFRIRTTRTGTFVVQAEHLGYRTTTRRVDLAAGDTVGPMLFVMATQPVDLDALIVHGENGVGREWGEDGFNSRRATEAGVFIDRLFIELLEPRYRDDLLRAVPGLMQGIDPRTGRMAFVSTRGRARCIRTYVNRQPAGDGAVTAALENLMGVEVYRNYSEVPEEFRNQVYPCGLVIYWTEAAWNPDLAEESHRSWPLIATLMAAGLGIIVVLVN